MLKFDHLRVAVKDWRESRDWYVENFGFKVEFELAGGGAERRGVAALQDDAGFTLFLEETGAQASACRCVFYFQVSDVDASYQNLRSKEVSFTHAPQQFFWGYGAELTDPDGTVIRIWDARSMAAR